MKNNCSVLNLMVISLLLLTFKKFRIFLKMNVFSTYQEFILKANFIFMKVRIFYLQNENTTVI